MRYLASAVLALLVVLPAAAQNRFFDLTASAVWVDPTGDSSFDDLSDPASIDFDADTGYGAAVNFFVSDRISIELAASKTSPEGTIRRRALGGGTTSVDIVPITGVVQFHFAPNSFIDPYIGAGAAYMLLGDVDGADDIQAIDAKDDVGLAVNAGLAIKLGDRVAIVADGKYVPIESDATARIVGSNNESQGTIDVSPIILSAGIQLRF
jgi:outer membrane protein